MSAHNRDRRLRRAAALAADAPAPSGKRPDPPTGLSPCAARLAAPPRILCGRVPRGLAHQFERLRKRAYRKLRRASVRVASPTSSDPGRTVQVKAHTKPAARAGAVALAMAAFGLAGTPGYYREKPSLRAAKALFGLA